MGDAAGKPGSQGPAGDRPDQPAFFVPQKEIFLPAGANTVADVPGQPPPQAASGIGEDQPAFARQRAEFLRTKQIAPGCGRLSARRQKNLIISFARRETAVFVEKSKFFPGGQGGLAFIRLAEEAGTFAQGKAHSFQLIINRTFVGMQYQPRRRPQQPDLFLGQMLPFQKVDSSGLSQQFVAVAFAAQFAQRLSQRRGF